MRHLCLRGRRLLVAGSARLGHEVPSLLSQAPLSLSLLPGAARHSAIWAGLLQRLAVLLDTMLKPRKGACRQAGIRAYL